MVYILDARGGIKIGSNVTIAGYCKLITGSHDINSPEFQADFLFIKIGERKFEIQKYHTSVPLLH